MVSPVQSDLLRSTPLCRRRETRYLTACFPSLCPFRNLDMSMNLFSGPIPDVMYALTKLKYVVGMVAHDSVVVADSRVP